MPATGMWGATAITWPSRPASPPRNRLRPGGVPAPPGCGSGPPRPARTGRVRHPVPRGSAIPGPSRWPTCRIGLRLASVASTGRAQGRPDRAGRLLSGAAEERHAPTATSIPPAQLSRDELADESWKVPPPTGHRLRATTLPIASTISADAAWYPGKGPARCRATVSTPRLTGVSTWTQPSVGVAAHVRRAGRSRQDEAVAPPSDDVSTLNEGSNVEPARPAPAVADPQLDAVADL